MFKNIFSFDGRIRRTEFGITYLIYMFFNLFVQLVVSKSEEENDFPPVLFILYLILLFLMYIVFAQGAKRCHDRGNSGWYQLIPFYVFWMIFGESEYGPNEYGPNPKGEGNHDEINEIGIKE